MATFAYLCFPWGGPPLWAMASMGWASDVSMGYTSAVRKGIHRRLMTMPKPMGAGLPIANEIRKTSFLPTVADQRLAAAWQVYLDNLAMVEVEMKKNLPQLEGAMSDWHQAAALAWDKWGIPSAKNKCVAQNLQAKDLGCFIDGDNGLLGIDTGRRLIVIMVTLFLIGPPNPHRLWLALVAGR